MSLFDSLMSFVKNERRLDYVSRCSGVNIPRTAATKPFTPAQMVRCLDELRAGFDNAEVIYRHRNRIVIRWRGTSAKAPLIIKMWSRPDLMGRLRQFLRLASGEHEWRTLVRLHEIDMAVP